MHDIILYPDSAVMRTIDVAAQSTCSRTLKLSGANTLTKALLYVFHRTRQTRLIEGEPMPVVDASAGAVQLDLKAGDLIYPGHLEAYVIATLSDGTRQRYPGEGVLRISVTGETRRYELGLLTRTIEEAFKFRNEAETFSKAHADGAVILKSALPRASDHRDEVWLVVDERSYYKSDGTTWSEVGTALAGITSEGELTAVPNFRCATIQALKHIPPTPNQARLVEGYHSPGDGGSGLFRWIPGDTTPTNGGTIIASRVDNHGPGEVREGRWQRVTDDGTVNVRWFGARGDGRADDTRAIQSAIDVAKSEQRSAVVLPAGMYRITSTIKIPAYVTLAGRGRVGWSNGHTQLSKDFSGAAVVLESEGSGLLNVFVAGNRRDGDGVHVIGGRSMLRNVACRRHGRDGFRFGGNTDAGDNTNLWRADTLFAVENGRHGAYIHDETNGVPNVNAGQLIHIDARENGGNGVHLGHARHNHLSAVVCQSNAGAGLICSGQAALNHVTEFYDEKNGAPSTLQPGAENNLVTAQLGGNRNSTRVVDHSGNESNAVHGWDHSSPGTIPFHDTVQGFRDIRFRDPSISGEWRQRQTAQRDLEVSLESTGADADFTIVHRRDGKAHLNLPTGMLKFQSEHFGTSTKSPVADAPDQWVQVEIDGEDYYLPAYRA